MIFHDQKRMASTILGNMTPAPMDAKMDAPEAADESKEGMCSAAEDMIAALHAKDADALVSAFMDMLEMAKDMKPEDDDDSQAPMPEEMPQ